VNLDQKIQLWNAVGTWVAGLGTLAAVIVSLYLASRSDRVKLRVNVGLRVIFAGDGSPAEEQVGFSVANLGDRPVTITSVGWRVGRGTAARFCVQPLYGVYTANCPKQLQHGDQATFLVSLLALPTWPKDFAKGFVGDLSERNLKTLRALVHTSIGETIEVRPDENLLKRLRDEA
jgi:hypothetical protein